MFFSISSLKHNLITYSNGVNFVKPFLAIVLILYPLKIPEASRFPGVFKGYKMGTLARNGPSFSSCKKLLFQLKNVKNNHSSTSHSLEYTESYTKKRHAPSFSKICTLHK